MKRIVEMIVDVNTAYCKKNASQTAMDLYRRIENL